MRRILEGAYNLPLAFTFVSLLLSKVKEFDWCQAHIFGKLETILGKFMKLIKLSLLLFMCQSNCSDPISPTSHGIRGEMCEIKRGGEMENKVIKVIN